MNKTVLITGTSTGIGRACALHFDRLGYIVYAGIRHPEDAQSLKAEATERLRPVELDVTDDNSILKATELVKSETGGRLDGLINNAGIGIGGPLEVTPVDEIHQVMNVNVIGLLAVTKAFIPMLREATGRIINIGSTLGYLAFPGASVYSASKFAVRAITDALRRELHPFGIKVALISPGAIESALWDKGKAYREALENRMDPETGALYDTLRRFGDSLYEDMKRIPASEVALVAADALTSKRPKRYYVVGKDAKGARRASYLPTALLDRIILQGIEKSVQKNAQKKGKSIPDYQPS